MLPWLRELVSRFATPARKAHRRAARKTILRVEQLEDRLVPAAPLPLGFQTGQILLGLDNGKIEVHDGTTFALVATLNDTGPQARGMAFDSVGNLFATRFGTSPGKTPPGPIAKFDHFGNLINASFVPASLLKGNPESIAIDANDNLFVGANSDAEVREFDKTGALLHVFSTKAIGATQTDWTQLTPDGKTLVIDTEGSTIFRMNAATGASLSPLATKLPAGAFALRFLPGKGGCGAGGGGTTIAGLLVADSTAILQFDASNKIIQTYKKSGSQPTWFALNRDPDLTSFWSAGVHDTTAYKFSIGTSAPTASFKVSGSGGIVGIAIVGEPTFATTVDTTPPRFAVGMQTGGSVVKVYEGLPAGAGGDGGGDAGGGGSTPASSGAAPLDLGRDPVFTFTAFPGFTRGVRVAVADVNNDGVADIIVATAAGTGPGAGHVKVFDGTDPSKPLLLDITPFGDGFTGGINLAATDFNGDGLKDIVAAMDSQGNTIRVFSGKDGSKLLKDIVPFGSFTGGSRVAAADENADSVPDIIAAEGPGGQPLVRIFDGTTGNQLAGRLGRFLAFESNFHGGVTVAVGSIFKQDCHGDIIVGTDGLSSPHIKVYNGTTGRVQRDFFAGPIGYLFFPDGRRLRGGVHVAATDLDGDGFEDILVTYGSPGYPKVRGYSGKTGGLLVDFSVFDTSFAGGVSIGGVVKQV